MSLFISHGAPTLLLNETPAHRFLKQLGGELPRPKAIIVISAHWESDQLQVDHTAQHDLIYDFRGFPKELYEFKWPVNGDPALAEKIQAHLAARGFQATLTSGRGLDHGAWVPLALLDSNAAIPIVPVSLPVDYDERALWALGKALSDFEREGYLLIGTGSLTHNLRALSPNWNAPSHPDVAPFVDGLKEILEGAERERIINWRALPYARNHHPSPEHFLPLLIAAAAPGKAQRLHQSIEYGALAMDCWSFGQPALA
ncbi:class III extradiol ring-cleavage dioxygenase [Marinobacter nanhaiticus D15-8W]|uniref:Dioxygenase n=1 Tax=Marinobacter nanhaiticus D15-8W TaxID=626887 RepID=N6X050_9GAMM|nr:class III extradiol ring-cleavage dioxygenase [Marinobacter nanhaiticus]ENO14428.1 dioxygenase [Marinobacter nanhaiticus D15-8W]BES71818.1 class III extradiol ring-cleavage dioxygenase [Marinobacter nanhaiticus D15-8W]